MIPRSSGILLPVFSLPSPYGIGTFGRAAYDFIDLLHSSGQRYWQMLPLGPTSYGDSPYQSFSTFAGNPYFIDLDLLCDEGLLKRGELPTDCGTPDRVDYGWLYRTRFAILEKAFARFLALPDAEGRLDAFRAENTDWLDDYALFMALKDFHGGAPWTEWDEPLRMREASALETARTEHAERIRFHIFLQYAFFGQYAALKAYAASRGIRIIGDVPIYVPLDSADVWASPDEFLLDERRMPGAVAGVPPDYFSADGQLWGNPLYDWAHMRETGYAWWIRRIGAAIKRFDVLRIDHFRAFSTYWSVPAGSQTARAGEWKQGPGMEFLSRIQAWFAGLDVIAEDLGLLSEDVYALVRASGFPGMKVLQFAFSGDGDNEYLPHRYGENCVCYTGTHDNTTAAAWFGEAKKDEADMARAYFGIRRGESGHLGMIRGGMTSCAKLFVTGLQDWLGLGGEARINTPGTLGGNWVWRMTKSQLAAVPTDTIRNLTHISGRDKGGN